jgi:glycosyltransferase involved in cell wall biosynthesis
MGGRLSVLISCFNQRDFIGQAVRSFFEQDHHDLEVVVLDDGSTDDSMEIIAAAAAEAPFPVRFETQENHGPAYTYRRLAEMASGDYLLFMGGDDFVPPNSLKRRIDMLDNDPDLMLASGLCKVFFNGSVQDFECPDEKTLALNGKSADDMLKSMKRYKLLEDGMLIFTATIFRKSDFMASGGFSADMKCDDSVLFYNLFRYASGRNRRFAVIPELVLFYRRHENNISKDPWEMWLRFSELYCRLGFECRRQASFSAYAYYMKQVRQSGRWYQKEIIKRIMADRAVIKYLTFGAICRDLLFPRFRRF